MASFNALVAGMQGLALGLGLLGHGDGDALTSRMSPSAGNTAPSPRVTIGEQLARALAAAISMPSVTRLAARRSPQADAGEDIGVVALGDGNPLVAHLHRLERYRWRPAPGRRSS